MADKLKLYLHVTVWHTLEFTVYCNMVPIQCSTIQFSSQYSTLQCIAPHTMKTISSFKPCHHCPFYFFTTISEMLISKIEIDKMNINEIGCRMYDMYWCTLHTLDVHTLEWCCNVLCVIVNVHWCMR